MLGKKPEGNGKCILEEAIRNRTTKNCLFRSITVVFLSFQNQKS